VGVVDLVVLALVDLERGQGYLSPPELITQ